MHLLSSFILNKRIYHLWALNILQEFPFTICCQKTAYLWSWFLEALILMWTCTFLKSNATCLLTIIDASRERYSTIFMFIKMEFMEKYSTARWLQYSDIRWFIIHFTLIYFRYPRPFFCIDFTPPLIYRRKCSMKLLIKNFGSKNKLLLAIDISSNFFAITSNFFNIIFD